MVEAQPLLGAPGGEDAAGSAPTRRSARPGRSGRIRRAVSRPASTSSAGALHAVHVAPTQSACGDRAAALAVLDVGFDDIAAVAHSRAARRARPAWRRRTRRRCRRRPRLRKRAPRFVEQGRVAATSRASSMAVRTVMSSRAGSAARERCGSPGRPSAWRPTGVERRLDHLLAPGRARLGCQEHEVDVAERRHLAAPVAAERDQADPLGRRGIGVRVSGVMIAQPSVSSRSPWRMPHPMAARAAAAPCPRRADHGAGAAAIW
jgi:hypothetical protein